MKKRREDIKNWVSLEKIAYYVQRLCDKDSNIGKIILVIKSHFCDSDLKKFAEKYKECNNNNCVRHIANLLISVPSKNMDKYLQNIVL